MAGRAEISAAINESFLSSGNSTVSTLAEFAAAGAFLAVTADGVDALTAAADSDVAGLVAEGAEAVDVCAVGVSAGRDGAFGGVAADAAVVGDNGAEGPVVNVG